MTDDQKAEALVKEVQAERAHTGNPWNSPTILNEALCRAIEQHEAFKQEVSDVMTYIKALYPTLPRNFNRFIIPKPKPDPLVEVMRDLYWVDEYANDLRAALEARGLEIREKSK
jgi:hypothetical protein